MGVSFLKRSFLRAFSKEFKREHGPNKDPLKRERERESPYLSFFVLVICFVRVVPIIFLEHLFWGTFLSFFCNPIFFCLESPIFPTFILCLEFSSFPSFPLLNSHLSLCWGIYWPSFPGPYVWFLLLLFLF